MNGPNAGLLDRRKAAEDAEHFFGPQLDVLREVVDYGTHLVPRLFSAIEPSIVREVAVGSLFSHVVQALDAIEALCRSGCADAAAAQARPLLEASLSLEWMLTAEPERRARAFYVWGLRQQRLWAIRGIPGTEEQQRIHAEAVRTFGNEAPDPSLDPAMAAACEERVRKIDEHLAREELREINDLFETMRRKRREVSTWHGVFSKTSWGMADELGRLGEYMVFYSIWSGYIHASGTQAHFQVLADEVLLLHPIRSIRGMSDLLRYALPLAWGTYRKLLDKLMPDERKAMDRKYIEEWRERYWALLHVDVKLERAPE